MEATVKTGMDYYLFRAHSWDYSDDGPYRWGLEGVFATQAELIDYLSGLDLEPEFVTEMRQDAPENEDAFCLFYGGVILPTPKVRITKWEVRNRYSVGIRADWRPT